MDTTAYLTRQGWRGAGHSLHPSGYGIKKPLLVSKKSNAFGIGKKQHDAHADQWWARAFDATLKDLNVSKDDASGKVTFGIGANQLEKVGRLGGKWAANGGLYGAFIRGQSLEGTITLESAEGNESYEAESAGGKRKLSVGEREERKRRRKRKTFKDVGLRALKVIAHRMSTEPVVDNDARNDARNEFPQKRAKDSEGIEETADKEARKLWEGGRRKSRQTPRVGGAHGTDGQSC